MSDPPSKRVQKPPLQVFLTGLLWALAGLMSLGSILDALLNALTLVTPSVTYIGTVVLVLGTLIAEGFLRFRPVPWVKEGHPMQLRSLGLSFWLRLLGVIVLLWIPRVVDVRKDNLRPTPESSFWLDEVQQVARKPLWDDESLGLDEITAKAGVRATRVPDSSVVAFWRLATGYETNWHVGRRTVGGNWRLVKLEMDSLSPSDPSDFLIGGIECKEDYGGEVAVVLLIVPQELIDKMDETWIQDENGWGFESLPENPGIVRSRILTFRTDPE